MTKKEPRTDEQEVKLYGFGVTLTVLLLGILNYSSSISGPILSTVGEAFPHVSSTTIKLISSIPMLMQCIFAPIVGIMTRRISVKKCLIISCIMTSTGILPVFTGSFAVLMLSRFTFGIGFGMGFPMVSVAIAELFSGEKRTALMGAKSAVGSLGGIILQTVSGFIAVYSWKLAFITHIFALLILVPVIIFLPDTGVKKAEKSANASSFINVRYIITVIFAFCLSMLQIAFMQEISFVISERNLGNSSHSAMVLNVFSAAAFFGGLLHRRITGIFGKYTVIFAAAMTGVSFVIGINSGSVRGLFIMAAFFGIGFSTSNPGLVLKVTDAAGAASNVPLAVSLYMSVTGLAQFLSPYFYAMCRSLAGNSSAVFAWYIAAVCIIAGTILGFFATLEDIL